MPLSGTFDTMTLADVIQWINAGQKSGTLTITVELEDTHLVFQDGDVAAVGSPDSLRFDIGQVLLNKQLIGEAELYHALRAAGKERSVVEVLLETGVLDEETVNRVQTENALETILDVFLREEGSFHFSVTGSTHDLLVPEEVPQSSFLREPLPTQKLLLDSMQQLDEWRQIREVFPNGFVVLHALDGESDNPAWHALRQAGDLVSVGELCLRLGGGRFTAYKQLFRAYSEGLIAIDEMSASPAAITSDTPVDALVDNARVLMAEQQFDEAREVLATAIGLAPDHAPTRAMRRELRLAQIEHLYQQLPPHRVPELSIPKSRFAEFSLNARETYLASRLTGRWDVATLVVATPLSELDTLRILRKFLHAGIAKLRQE